MGFAQAAESKQVREYMMRGKDLTSKHIKIFVDTLLEEDLPAPMRSDSPVTDSTVSPFSDAMMMFNLNMLNATHLGQYGISLGACLRRDVGIDYIALSY